MGKPCKIRAGLYSCGMAVYTILVNQFAAQRIVLQSIRRSQQGWEINFLTELIKAISSNTLCTISLISIVSSIIKL